MSRAVFPTRCNNMYIVFDTFKRDNILFSTVLCVYGAGNILYTTFRCENQYKTSLRRVYRLLAIFAITKRIVLDFDENRKRSSVKNKINKASRSAGWTRTGIPVTVRMRRLRRETNAPAASAMLRVCDDGKDAQTEFTFNVTIVYESVVRPWKQLNKRT